MNTNDTNIRIPHRHTNNIKNSGLSEYAHYNTIMLEKIIHKDLSYLICGLCFKAHNNLGQFLSEKSYADYLEQLFILEKISYKREQVLEPLFENEKAGRNRPDFIIDNKIILE